MLINDLYVLPDPHRLLIRRKDGLYSFIPVPYRKITDADLTPIVTPFSEDLYLKSVHADVFDGPSGDFTMKQYGLTKIPLVEARRAAGLTQKELADASGVNVRQIQRVELGEAEAGNLTAKNLLAIADALGVGPKELI